MTLQNQPVRKTLAGLVGLTLAACLTGCANDDAAPDLDETAVASPDAEPTEYVPASADGPAQNVPEPRLPAVATENTEEGAEATLEYFWEATNYGRLTGRTEHAALVSDEACELCLDLIQGWQEVYEEGAWADVHGEFNIELNEIVVSTDDVSNSDMAELKFQLTEPPTDFYEDGYLLEDESFDTESTAEWLAQLSYDGTAQRWQIDWVGLEEHSGEEAS